MTSKPVLYGLGPDPIPAQAGIGLRTDHFPHFLQGHPPTPWLEIHPENYFGPGGKPRCFLERIRPDYPLSLHGVGLSLGSTDPLNRPHLDQLKELIRDFQPALVSEHISWGSVEGRYHNDLLPLPYTEEALDHMVERVSQVQETLGRRILMENVSSYLQFKASTLREWEFVAELARRADCGLLLDVNNIYVNARNHGFDPETFLYAIPPDRVEEIHLAGFTVNALENGEILIDTHSRPVCDQVWALYRAAIEYLGPKPTLIEWDADLPPLKTLLEEADRAGAMLSAIGTGNPAGTATTPSHGLVA